MRPNYSIIVVGYNNPKLVENCLASIARNGHLISRTREVILVNNGPDKPCLPDNADQYIKVINSPENKGFGDGVNQAAKIAQGEYLILLNPDAALQEDTIGELSSFIDSHPAAAVIGMKQKTKRGQIVSSFGKFPNAWREFAALTGVSKLFPVGRLINPTASLNSWYNKTGLRDWVSGGAMCVKKEWFDRVQGFDTNFFLYVEDIDLCHRINLKGGQIWYCAESIATHDFGGTGSRQKAQQFTTAGLLYFAKKNQQAVRPLAAIQNIKSALRAK